MFLKIIIKKIPQEQNSSAAAAAAAWCRARVGVAVTGLSQAAGDSHK